MWARAAKHRGLVADEAESGRWQEERGGGLDERCVTAALRTRRIGDCFGGVITQQV